MFFISTFDFLKTKHYFIIITLALLVTACDHFNRTLKSTDYEFKFKKAKEYYDKSDYVKSSQLYEELIPVVKGTEKAEEVYYYYTWSEYNLGDFILSQYHFKNYTRQFPAGKHVEECLFMNAYCFYLTSANYKLDQTSTKNAIKEFQSFVDEYSSSEKVDSCNILMDQLRGKLIKKDYEIIKQYYKQSEWKAAIVAAQIFIKDYPASIYDEEMHLLLIDSYYVLAINSVQSKKEERLDGAIENYVKFLDLYPNSSYLSRAESIYSSCKKLKENLN